MSFRRGCDGHSELRDSSRETSLEFISADLDRDNSIGGRPGCPSPASGVSSRPEDGVSRFQAEPRMEVDGQRHILWYVPVVDNLAWRFQILAGWAGGAAQS